jgi:hypothetical protein
MQDGRPAERDAEPRHAVVPVPGSLRSEPQRKPFWRRLRLGRVGGVGGVGGALARARGELSPPTDDDRILARLDALAAQITASERSLGQRVEQLDRKFGEVWEVEETLSRLTELHELLLEARERQARIDGRLRNLERRLSLAALLAGAAAVAGIVAALGVLAS